MSTEYTPTLRDLRDLWLGHKLDPLPLAQAIELGPNVLDAFDDWLETFRAKAKAEAWDECARSIVYEDGTPVEIASITNPYKETE